MRALTQAVQSMPAKRRSVVISGAGDRRDEDIREQTQILGAVFDDVLLYQDAAQRGRADGEVMGLLRAGLQGASRTRHVEEIRGEFAAIDIALERLQPVPGAGGPGGGGAGASGQAGGRGQGRGLTGWLLPLVLVGVKADSGLGVGLAGYGR
jgi:UDP-N-acetylmuramyl tripeptide synthase